MLPRGFEANAQTEAGNTKIVAHFASAQHLSAPQSATGFRPDAELLFQTISDLSPVGRLVEYWCAAAVAEELHFTRAANRLHIDQSALSRHIQKLEASLGAKLFIRGERKVELTETADAFIPFARKALAAARAGVQVAQSIARGEPQEFEIAYSTCVDSRLIARFRELVEGLGFRFPVRFRSFPPDQLIGRLFIGESFAVLTQLPVLESVAQTTVLMEELFVAVRNDHYLAEKAQATLSDLGNAPVIWPAGAMPTALTVDLFDRFRKVGYVPNVLHEAQSVAESIGLAREGLGATFIKTSEVLLAGDGLRVLPLSEPIPIETGVLSLRGRRSEILKDFLIAVNDHFRLRL